MKTNITRLALVAALSFAAIGATYAHEDNSEAGTNHWISHLSDTKSAPTANQLAPYGYAASRNPDREVTLSGSSKYLNVTRLETVRINLAGKSIVWTFDTLGTTPFPLSKAIPGADGITVFVSENPAYQGG